MSSPDISLLALMSNRENYDKFRKIVAKESITLSETATSLADYEAYFRAFPSAKQIDWNEFRTYVRIVRHPEWKPEKFDAYDAIMARVEEAHASGVAVGILDHFQRIQAVGEIIEVCNDVAHGKHEDLSPIIDIVSRVKRETIGTNDISSYFGPTDLSAVLESRIRSSGVEWRLDSFNLAVGPLHSGDFVMLYARPEAGKTSWLCSELTHMVKFLPEDKDAVIFNPEEGGGRLFLRLVTAALNDDVITVASDEVSSKVRYEREVQRMDRIKVVEPAGGISTRDIEKVLDRGNYGLVAINVLDKIKMPSRYSQEKEVDRYRSLAYWLRETANRYSVPILAVAQADAAAEGQRFLTQSMIYGSKTGVQGEADLLLGMGYDSSMGDRRCISLLKNKLPGGVKTNPLMKHAKIEVEISPATGRFKDI